jgi:hypothetical protein
MPQIFDHTCEPVHGGQAGPLVKIRPIASASLSAAYAGRVVTLNSNGEFRLGNGGNTVAMPLFLIKGVEAPSVYDTGGTGWVPGHIGDYRATALVASGGFEVQTTEFDDTKTYAPNDPLTADANGVVTKPTSGSVYANWIVGIASVHEGSQNYDPPYLNYGGTGAQPPVGYNVNRKKVLTFWSVYLPKTQS